MVQGVTPAKALSKAEKAKRVEDLALELAGLAKVPLNPQPYTSNPKCQTLNPTRSSSRGWPGCPPPWGRPQS